MSLLPVQEALQRITTRFAQLPAETISLESGLDRVLAQAVAAPFDLPQFDAASMDGFAVRAADVTRACSATPVILQVVDDIPAGRPSAQTLQRGQAMRIMTGAQLPAGADAVVPVEASDHPARTSGAPLPKNIGILSPTETGANIRKAGSEMQRGTTVLRCGQRLRAQDLGMLAMLGLDEIVVTRRPRVALLSSGDEVVPVGQLLKPGQVYDVNTHSLSALIRASGCDLIPLGLAADRPASIRQALDRAVHADADLIVTSAGVSMGAYDFTRDVVASEGELHFWKTNMRPGKPLTFGAYRGVPLIGLAGNPVSAFVGFMVFVQPVVGIMLGLAEQPQRRVRVRLAEAVRSDGRESYLRAVVSAEDNVYTARLTGTQSSGHIFSLVQANALLIIPAGVQSLPAGAEADAWLLTHKQEPL